MRIFFALAISITSTLHAVEQAAGGPAIDVVKTWSDLATQPAVSLGKNATARFGIQALRGPRLSGVLIYCMTEAFDPDSSSDMDEDGLGPFKLLIKSPDQHSDLEEIKKAARDSIKKRREYGRLLFAQIIPLSAAGIYTIDVKNAAGEVVATARIECTADAYHAWAALDCPIAVGKPLADETGNKGPVATLKTAPGIVSLPKLRGNVPIRYWLSNGERGPVKFDENDILPVLVEQTKITSALTPEQAVVIIQCVSDLRNDSFSVRKKAYDTLITMGPTIIPFLQKAEHKTRDPETLLRLRQISAEHEGPFHIELDGNVLRLKTKLAFQDAGFEDLFLARWWVNGKAVAGHLVEHEILKHLSGLVIQCNSARLKLNFNLAALGAKSGDTISLQMMYCPDGTHAIGNGLESMLSPARASDVDEPAYPERFPVLSNRIDFIAP